MSDHLRIRDGRQQVSYMALCREILKYCYLSICFPFFYLKEEYEIRRICRNLRREKKRPVNDRTNKMIPDEAVIQCRIKHRNDILARHSRESRANAKQTSRLLTLPPEIRLQIIRMVYEDTTLHIWRKNRPIEGDDHTDWNHTLCSEPYHRHLMPVTPDPVRLSEYLEPHQMKTSYQGWRWCDICCGATGWNRYVPNRLRIGGLHLVCRDLAQDALRALYEYPEYVFVTPMDFDSPSTAFYNFASIRNLTFMWDTANWTAISQLQNLQRLVCIYDSPGSRSSDEWYGLPIANAPRNGLPSADLLSGSKADLILVRGGMDDWEETTGFVYVSEQEGWVQTDMASTPRAVKPAPGWRALEMISDCLICTDIAEFPGPWGPWPEEASRSASMCNVNT